MLCCVSYLQFFIKGIATHTNVCNEVNAKINLDSMFGKEVIDWPSNDIVVKY